MSVGLLWAVGILYFFASLSAAVEGKYWLALMLICYSVANYALIRMAQ